MTRAASAAARSAACLGIAALAIVSGPASAADDPPDAGQAWSSCVEHVPSGAARPKLVESFPTRGLSGWAAPLEITVTHGRGETVLPEGFKVQGSGDTAKALEASGFRVPDPDGGSGPTMTTEPQGETAAVTKLKIPFLPLPKHPGRNLMVLPPVPVAVARASGEVVTVCTESHEILVEDPIANEADPKVRPNPDPRPQREEWVLAKQLVLGALAGAALTLAAAWLVRRWMRRPRVVVGPPPKLPWIAAYEELEAIRRSSLLVEHRTGEYFDKVSDCVRKYLGARYGFDGLETTTDEMRSLLRRIRPAIPGPELNLIAEFLADCDLVKFARVEPTEQEARSALLRGEEIVRRTMPRLDLVRPAAGGGPSMSAAAP